MFDEGVAAEKMLKGEGSSAIAEIDDFDSRSSLL